jgi:rhamnosyltransferase
LAVETTKAVVVDNGSDSAELEMIMRAVDRHAAHLIRNCSNRGIAAALNQGVQWALGEGFRWVLLLDQDSEPLPEMGPRLLAIYHLASADSKTAIVGSNFYDRRLKRLRFPSLADAPCGWTVQRTVIGSGSLIECAAFAAVQGFREDLFLDSVDHDFCLRVRRKGFQVVLAARPLMRHTIGAPTVHHFVGMEVSTSNHSAERRYYMVRNRLLLARENLRSEPRWVAANLCFLLLDTLVMVLFEGGRRRKVWSVMVGAWHGLLGRTGERDTAEVT